ncbi:MAG TPA: MmgE/PrpD family protein [Xanthobacteraceae bacterium]
MALTSEIGQFLAGGSPLRVPPAAAAIVKTGFTDCVGVMLAGWREPVVGIVAAGNGAAAPEHPFAASCLRMPAADRALLYGVAAHVLDYDDTALSGHPSAVLVPAILAAAQEAGADGRRMIAAYAAGYEIWSELVARQKDPLHRKGWHPSAVLGAVAAAGGSAVLRGLDAGQASHAVGIAASLAGGVVANFGSMTKSLQVARAAQSGLVAARLAQHGMTASADAIEHDVGYLQAISMQGRVDRSSPARLGREWTILESGLNVKLYPMCYCTHRILDGMLDLRRDHALSACDIAAVAVEIGETEAVILRNHRPQNALDAKFSAEFAMAAAATVGSCGPAELTDAFVRRGEIQEFFPRVQISTHPDKVAAQSTVDAPNRVVVTLRDGGALDSGPISHPRGHFKRPIDADRLWGKFAECTAQAMEEAHARALFAQLQELEGVAAVSDLACVRAAPSQAQPRLERVG